MSPPAGERGGHARPRGLFAPRPRPNSGSDLNAAAPGLDATPVPDPVVREPLGAPPGPDSHPSWPGHDTPAPNGGVPWPGNGASAPDSRPPAPDGQAPVPDGQAPGPAAQNSTNPAAPAVPAARRSRPAPGGSRPARHVAPSPGRPGRKASPAARRAKRSRIAAVAIVAIGILVIGLATGFGSELSAEPTVQSFLDSWQEQQYDAAGALTTAPAATVAAELRGAVAQLDTAQLFLSMKSVAQHGSTADASFTATVDLAQQGRVWTYQGHFGLRRVGDDWKVVWAPSVINPNLGPGERLAVVTTFPDRAAVLDAKGDPLQVKAPAYVLGVVPDRLASPAETAQAFAKYTKLQAGQVLGQITAAPPHSFLRLATLDPPTYSRLLPSLRAVPGLVVRSESQRLFQSKATALVGAVGSEINEQLRADGALYAPGTTVGLSGLEQKYQRQLLGTPTTEVVAVNSAGQQTGVLAQWPGTAGTPVRTTIDSSVQGAALTALDGVPNSGEIVAVSASTGEVLAIAQHQASGPLPAAGALNAQLTPGTAFTIVSAAALAKKGVTPSTSMPCVGSFTVQGRTFTSEGTGAQRPFGTDFAEGCSTAFVGLSERLTASEWTQVVREFGIGSDWSHLQVPAFSGSVPSAAGDANLAAQTIGQGNVRMSLLSMAMVAATVDAGRWHVPAGAPGPRSAQRRRPPGHGRDEHGARAHARRGPLGCRPAGQPARSAGVRPGRHGPHRFGLDELVRRLPRRHRDRRDRDRQDTAAFRRRPGRRLLLGCPLTLGQPPWRPGSPRPARRANGNRSWLTGVVRVRSAMAARFARAGRTTQ